MWSLLLKDVGPFVRGLSRGLFHVGAAPNNTPACSRPEVQRRTLVCVDVQKLIVVHTAEAALLTR